MRHEVQLTLSGEEIIKGMDPMRLGLLEAILEAAYHSMYLPITSEPGGLCSYTGGAYWRFV